MPIFVLGSLNPAKLAAVKLGAQVVWPDVEILTVNAPSGVSAQPMGDDETIAGAVARARASLALWPKAAFGVGLEGGVVQRPEGLFATAWCAIVGDEGRVGLGSTGRFLLPPAVAALVLSGVELGEADDRVFGRTDSRLNDGAIGLLTHGAMNRATLYAHAVTLAAVRFVNTGYWD